MGGKYQAEQRVEHVAIACKPDMIKPDPKSPPLPFITYSEFDTAVGVATNTAGNQHPAFVSVSKVPTCKGGPPGGQGIKSGTWNGQFVPTEWSSTLSAGPGWQVFHGHKGTINNGNTEAQVYTAVAAGAPSSPCIAALQVQFKRVKEKAVAEAATSPGQFGKDMAGGAWDSVKGYGDTAVSLWDGLKSVAGAVWNDPAGSAQKALAAIGDAGKAAVKGLQQVGGLAKAVASSELTVDDVMDGLQDIVSEVGEEGACALAKMLKDLADAPGGVGEAVGALTVEVAIQVGLAFVSGGAGNAAAAGAKAAKGGKYAEAGLDVIGKSGDKLRAMGLKEGDDITSFLKKLKERRAARRGNAPDEKPKSPERNPEPAKDGNRQESQNKGQGNGEAKDACPLCPTAGGPVNPVQGCKVLGGDEDLDFVLPGLVPLHWQRCYASNSAEVSWFGQGWSVPFTLMLRVKDGGEAIDFIDAFGRTIAFPGVAPGREFFSPSEGITLRRGLDGGYAIAAGDGSAIEFAQRIGDLLMCTALQDGQGRAHRLYWSAPSKQGELPQPRHVMAQGGQVLALRFEARGRHAGRVATRLVEVVQLGDASADASNPLRSHLDPHASFELRCQQLHQALLGDQLRSPARADPLVRYDYDADGNLSAVTVPDPEGRLAAGPRRRFAWQDHLMVQHEQPDGWSLHYRYDRNDPQGRVVHHWQTIEEPGRGTARRDWQFDYASDHTRVVEAAGTSAERATTYHFNAKRRWTGTTDALGGRTWFELNGDGQTTAVVDPMGRRTEYLLDGRGRPMLVVNANGERSSIVWHPTLERPLQVIDPMGGAVRYEVDDAGQLLAETDALGRRTEFRLDARGLPYEVHDAKGGIKRLAHDDWGQVTLYTDCSGRSTALAYDAFGHLASSRNALGETTHYRHDRDGHLLSVQHPDGSQEQFAYDRQGRLIRHEDAAGAVTQWTLAADGLPIERVNALGRALRYHYDAHRRLVTLTNENGDPYAFDHDALDRLLQETTFDGKRTRYRYDAAGQTQQLLELGDAQATEADRIETRFERDAVGRLLSKRVKAAEGPLLSTRFGYDANGALLLASNSHSRIDLRYDAAGQLIEEQLTASGQAPSGQRTVQQGGGRQHRLRHQYDELGNRIATVLPDGRVLNMLTYGSGHVHQINLDGQLVSDIERDALHREVARSQGRLVTTQRYDAMGRLLQQRVQRAVGGPAARAGHDGAAIDRQYRYAAAGRLSHLQDWRRGIHYGHDLLGQLVSANEERFAFDPAHNLLPATPAGGRVDRNRLLVYEDQRFEHDVHGRMVHKRQGRHTDLRLQWNAEHQLERSELQRAEGAPVVTGYAYDPFGRRLYKAPLDARGQPTTERATWFVWDGNRLLQELRTAAVDDVETDPAGISEARTYVYEPESFVPLAQLWTQTPMAEAANAGGIGRIASMPLRIPRPGRAAAPRSKPPADPAEVRYYHCDQIGTPRELTAEDGQIAWQATYAAWGNTLTVAWTPPVPEASDEAGGTRDDSALQPLRFQGQYFDVETGLHYNRFRYYDPNCGRYATQDPIGLMGSLHLQQYVPDPTQWTDPLGLSPKRLCPICCDDSHGRSNKQERLRALADDPKQPRWVRGWVRNELRHIETGNRRTVRLPGNSRNSRTPGKELAHGRNTEAKDGYCYRHSVLQDAASHKTQHQIGGY